MSKELTTEEKIDYIYKNMKSEERWWYFRTFLKVLIYGTIIGYCVYFYYWGFENMKQDFIESIKPNINTEEVIDGIKEKSGNMLKRVKELF
ncbi:MAG: hypothetical protein Q9M94_06730 [Candidatus Gracilibacteria bacterium]|nr:hypothetical protein [Candidatus Gracilibacteria bacterium]MDQ7023438.1 hypothetical protein [Candidatus Gracilibacteria bacterium]